MGSIRIYSKTLSENFLNFYICSVFFIFETSSIPFSHLQSHDRPHRQRWTVMKDWDGYGVKGLGGDGRN